LPTCTVDASTLPFFIIFKIRRERNDLRIALLRCFQELLLSLKQFIIVMSATAAEDAALIIRRSLQREIGLLETKKG
jgi:hypothetical protein